MEKKISPQKKTLLKSRHGAVLFIVLVAGIFFIGTYNHHENNQAVDSRLRQYSDKNIDGEVTFFNQLLPAQLQSLLAAAGRANRKCAPVFSLTPNSATVT